MLGFTDLRDTRLHGHTLHTWQTVDQGPYSARSLTVREDGRGIRQSWRRVGPTDTGALP